MQDRFNLSKIKVRFLKCRKIGYFLYGDRLGKRGVIMSGVLILQSLRTIIQMYQTLKKANAMFIFIVREFEYKSVAVFLQLYGILPLFLRKEVLTMVEVQQRFSALMYEKIG